MACEKHEKNKYTMQHNIRKNILNWILHESQRYTDIYNCHVLYVHVIQWQILPKGCEVILGHNSTISSFSGPFFHREFSRSLSIHTIRHLLGVTRHLWACPECKILILNHIQTQVRCSYLGQVLIFSGWVTPGNVCDQDCIPPPTPNDYRMWTVGWVQ